MTFWITKKHPWREILPTYYQRHRNGTVRTADFIDVAEEIAGSDLADLFDAWLYEDAIPEFPSG